MSKGEEVLHLPTIVEAAESSPAAATEAARFIRKFLSKDNHQRAYVQYNAVMLVRILADNPGPSFTKNIDHKFVETVKDLVRDGPDGSVRHILWETLDSFQTTKANEPTLSELNNMWKKEKDKLARRVGILIFTNFLALLTLRQIPGMGATYNAPAGYAPQQGPPQQPLTRPRQQRNHEHNLPPPVELQRRLGEARESVSLFYAFVGTTPPERVLTDDLLREFAQRCRDALRSIQAYIFSNDPVPDLDTLETLVKIEKEISFQLSSCYEKYLNSRRIYEDAMVRFPDPSRGQQQQQPANMRYSAFGPHEAPNDTTAASVLPPSSSPPAAPPPGPPPGRQPLDTKAAGGGSQNPFGDHNETAPGMADLQPPLQPQMYGLPPPSVSPVSGYPHPGPGNGVSPSPTHEYTREIEYPADQQQLAASKPRYRF